MPLENYMNDPNQLTEEELMQLQDPTGQVTSTDIFPGDPGPLELPAIMAYASKDKVAAKPKADNSSVAGLETYIKNLEAQKQPIDWTPAAAFLDTTFGGNLSAAAKATKGMNKEDKAFKLGALQNELAKRKNEIDRNAAAAQIAEGNQAAKDQLMEIRKQGVSNQGLRIGNMQDKIAADIANRFDNDSILKKIEGQTQQIDIDKHTLATSDVLTPQVFNEIQIGIANAISGGRSAAVSTQNKVEFDSAAIQLKRIQQRLTNKPEDIASPEVKKYLTDLLSRLGEAYENNAYERAKQIEKGRSLGYRHNPDAKAVMKEKVNYYKPVPKIPVEPMTEGSAPVNGPQPGDIEDGHKFMGGDPSDQTNWVPIDQEQ